MIKTKKNLQLLDYQGSYFYQKQRQKRKKRIALIILLSLLLVLVTVISFKAIATEISKNELNENQFSPRLTFNHPDPEMRLAVPVDMQADIQINGLVAHMEIKQVFMNPHSIPLEGQYLFPLPDNAAVSYLKIEVADTVIEGKIMEKQQAKVAYQRAKSVGKKASLVQQERPNLFTNKIANIPANAAVVVTLKVISPVMFEQGQLSLSLPLSMTQRYHPNSYTVSPAEQDSQLLPPLAKALAQSQASVNIRLNAGVPITNLLSNSHRIQSKAIGNELSEYFVTLDKRSITAERNFVLSWKTQTEQMPKVTSFVEQVEDSYYTLLTFFPPQQGNADMPRDVIFIVDTSGSMQGRSIKQAKSSLHHAIAQLNKQDSFNIIAFDNTTEQLFSQTEMVSSANLSLARQFIDDLKADGGTEMYRPLSQALAMIKTVDQQTSAIRQIVFITDGAVANEFELMQLLTGNKGNFRLFTVGIGAAPNGYFMKKAAQFGRGSYVFVRDISEVNDRINHLMAKISQPALTDIQLIFDNQVHADLEIFPRQIPDLYQDEPLQVAVKSQLPINTVQVLGNTASMAWYHQVIIDNQNEGKAISTVWARRKIEDLIDGLVTGSDAKKVKEEVINTSIAHQIISPYTSFIAIEQQPKLPLLAKNKLTTSKLSRMAEHLQVALPKTALGWKQQLFIALGLYVLAFSIFKFYRHRYG